MKTLLSLFAPAALLLALLPSAPCAAQGLDFTLATPTITAGTSSTDQVFTFNGTLTNTSSTPLYLNGDLFNVDAPLTGDDSGFINTLLFPTDSSGNPINPSALGAGQSLTLSLFNVTIPTGTALGTYSGLFQIQGGATPNDYDVLASQTFTVNASSNTAPPSVPEVPGGSALAVGVLMTAGLAAVARRKKGAVAA